MMNPILEGGPRPASLVDMQDRLDDLADLAALLADIFLVKAPIEGRSLSGVHHIADKITSEVVALRDDLERMRRA